MDCRASKMDFKRVVDCRASSLVVRPHMNVNLSSVNIEAVAKTKSQPASRGFFRRGSLRSSRSAHADIQAQDIKVTVMSE